MDKKHELLGSGKPFEATGKPFPLGTAAKYDKYLIQLDLTVDKRIQNQDRFKFIATDERVDLDTEQKHFVTLTHGEIEDMVDHELLRGPNNGPPILNDEDRNVLGAMLCTKQLISNGTPRDKKQIMAYLERKRHARERGSGGAQILHEDAMLRRQHQIYEEMEAWLDRPLVMGRPDGSQYHKFEEQGRSGRVYVALKKDMPLDDAALPWDIASNLSGVHSFVVEHNWSGVLGHAEISGQGAGSITMPYPVSCFEFVIGGRRTFGVVVEPPDDSHKHTTLVIVARFGDDWGIVMAYRVHDDWSVSPQIRGRFPEVDKLQPLADLIAANIKAVGILLETKIVEREVVRVDERLNRARAKRGKPPLSSYHVVALSRRERVRPRLSSELDPDREITRKRWHLVRSHWRQYETHRTRIEWHSRGDLDLGIVDKEYKL